MKQTLHILLQIDPDADTLGADEAAEEALAIAQAAALRVASRVRVVDYSVTVVPCSRAALEGALAKVAEALEAARE